MSLYKDASLVMIPSAVKDGKLYSIRPTDGDGDFTFSRGSNLAATRVDVNGLIEKGRENLLLQSNQFDTTWTLNTATITGGQAGYDNTNNAWKLDAAAGGSYVQQIVSANNIHTYSAYVKAGTTNYVLFLTGGAGNAFFNLSTGQVGTTAGLVDASIVSVGNGWYRCSLVQNASMSYIRMYPAGAGGTQAGSIYIQDAQLEAGLVATDYIETGASTAQAGILEDMPRLDYSGSCPALLLEPQRTNKLTYSEYFGGFSQSEVSLDFGYLAPDGTNSAYKVTNTSVGSGGSLYKDGLGLLADDTRSIWARTTNGTGSVDLLTYYDNTNNTFSITEEWQRFNVSSVTTSVGQGNFYAVDFRGGGLDEVILWGGQAEAGSYPTSYIPTYGSAVTRSYDNPFLTGASSLIGQTQGSVLVELTRDALESYTQRVVTLSDGTSNNTIGLQLTAGNSFSYYVSKDGVLQGLVTKANVTTANQKVKVAFAYAENDFVMYVDGVLAGTDTSGSIPAVNTIKFQRENNGLGYVGLMNQLLVFPTRLTNAELAALTA